MPAEKEERVPGQMDAYLLELLENRLSNKVSERVEQALKWRYGLLAVGIAGIIGFFGWSVKESIDGQINHAVMTAKEKVVQDISILTKEVDEISQTTQISLGVTADQQRRAGALMDGIEKQLGEFTNKLKTLEQLGGKVDTLEVQRKNIEAQLGKAGVGAVTVQNTTEKLADLARQVEELTKLVSVQQPQASADIVSSVQTIIQQSEQAVRSVKEAVRRTTVFFQFAGPPREQAQAISGALRQRGYAVPGEERLEIASGLREVRYFHESDSKAAEELAADTTETLTQLGYKMLQVKVQSLTNWAGVKPQPGLLELWLSLPRL